MKSTSLGRSCRFIAIVFGCLTALAALPVAAAAQEPCDLVTVTPSSPGPGEPFQICGPSGAQYYYSWRNEPSDPTPFSTSQCVTFPAGLGPGVYTWEHTYSVDANGNGPDPTDPYYKCLVEVVIEEEPGDLTCVGVEQRPEGTICAGETKTLCAPVGDGYYYTWRDENDVIISTDRCVEVSRDAGCYEYHVTISDDLTGNGPSQDDPYIKCTLDVCFEECDVNCPRTIGFWQQQCAQRTGGSTKFTEAQMDQITAEVDALSDFFSWGNDFDSFCAAMNPSAPVDQREQALRQFAGTLANVATGNLGLETNNGEFITLDLSTEITCDGDEMTIGELIDLADARFAALAGASLSDEDVKAEYAKFIGCFDAINNGIGIGAVCSDDDEDLRTADQTGVRNLTVSPNPLVNFTRLQYTVATDGDLVDLAVFDVAGRQIRKLVEGPQQAGLFQAGWDGTDGSGARVRSGVYFIRGSIGADRVSGRVMVVR
jgi:hypothetical protein